MKYKIASASLLLVSLITLLVYFNLKIASLPVLGGQSDSIILSSQSDSVPDPSSVAPSSVPASAVVSSAAPKPAKATQSAPAATTKTTAKESPVSTTPVVTVPLVDVSGDKYGYSLLSDSEKLVYSQIVEGIESVRTDISITPTKLDVLNKIFNYIVNDNPQYFWLNINGYTYYYNPSTNESNRIVLAYYITADQKSAAVSAVQAAAANILSKVNGSMTDYQKAIILHDALVNSVVYDGTATMMHNMYGALVDKRAVCDGYSRAYQYLLNKAGVYALIAVGDANNGKTTGPHAWNVIRMGGNYYHVDVTWDDSEAPASSVAFYYQAYLYFGLTTQQIGADHTVSLSSGYPIPSCTATEFNYFIKEGLLFSSYSSAKASLESMIRAANPTKFPYLKLRFTSKTEYEIALANIGTDMIATMTAINSTLTNKLVNNSIQWAKDPDNSTNYVLIPVMTYR